MTPELVHEFVNMIVKFGPQPRFLNFFAAISEVSNVIIIYYESVESHQKSKVI